jgi:hypothetical protein
MLPGQPGGLVPERLLSKRSGKASRQVEEATSPNEAVELVVFNEFCQKWLYNSVFPLFRNSLYHKELGDLCLSFLQTGFFRNSPE